MVHISQTELLGDAPTSVTVGSSSTLILAAVRDRQVIIIANDSDETIYLGFGNAAVLNSGVRLDASGGIFNSFEAGFVNLEEINAICASGSKNLCVQTFGS